MRKCGIFILLLALSVGIFWMFQNKELENWEENGTLVKHIGTICKEGRSV